MDDFATYLMSSAADNLMLAVAVGVLLGAVIAFARRVG